MIEHPRELDDADRQPDVGWVDGMPIIPWRGEQLWVAVPMASAPALDARREASYRRLRQQILKHQNRRPAAGLGTFFRLVLAVCLGVLIATIFIGLP